jgi:hypothetical protein
MALSIEDKETDALIRKLAKARKLSYTAAIRLAVSNELAKVVERPKKDPEKIRAAIREMQDRIAERGGLPSMREMDDWLYDESRRPH